MTPVRTREITASTKTLLASAIKLRRARRSARAMYTVWSLTVYLPHGPHSWTLAPRTLTVLTLLVSRLLWTLNFIPTTMKLMGSALMTTLTAILIGLALADVLLRAVSPRVYMNDVVYVRVTSTLYLCRVPTV
jgi:hypothetical protein